MINITCLFYEYFVQLASQQAFIKDLVWGRDYAKHLGKEKGKKQVEGTDDM